MASAQVVETSVNTNNSPSQDYTTNPDDHSNHNITDIAKSLRIFLFQTFLFSDEGFNWIRLEQKSKLLAFS